MSVTVKVCIRVKVATLATQLATNCRQVATSLIASSLSGYISVNGRVIQTVGFFDHDAL